MVSIISAPDNLHPAYNPSYYYINSNNKSETGFRYIVEIKDAVSNNLIARWTLKPRPIDGYGEIDISRALQIELDKKFNEGLLKWESNLEQVLRYRVEFGEEYQVEWNYFDYTGANFTNVGGSSLGPPNFMTLYNLGVASSIPFVNGDVVRVIQNDTSVKPQLEGIFTVNNVFLNADVFGTTINGIVVGDVFFSSGPVVGGKVVYADGRKTKFSNLINVEKIAFRGAFPFLDYKNYLDSDYNLDEEVDTTRLLTTHPDGLKIRKNNFLHINTFDSNVVKNRWVYFEMDNGDLYRYLGSHPGQVYKDFNAVPSDDNIEQFSVNGGSTWFSFTSGFNLYDYDSYDYYIVSSSFNVISEKKNVKIYKECDRYEIFQLTFMDRLGSWVSYNFNKANYINIEVDRVRGRKKWGDVSGGNWTYDKKDVGSNVYSVEERMVMTLNTSYLDEYEAQYFKELLTSPFIFLGDDNGIVRRVNILNTAYRLDKKRTRRGIIYSVDIEFAINDNINI